MLYWRAYAPRSAEPKHHNLIVHWRCEACGSSIDVDLQDASVEDAVELLLYTNAGARSAIIWYSPLAERRKILCHTRDEATIGPGGRRFDSAALAETGAWR